ncbi:tetratricopeptide repeat-containing sensor histidine kinase [Winogradskyella psychrotolerans]|uniref:tetratricopeptide repeat-containing sensor histidine kinase n=1 Tax=Winogradskyella psychrotolerans TaxID=1344585 RepID=UPI001C0714BE|nr:sensor histidine kinase [Winogradskyella psychrotolerans]MBU2927818.1 sensor histidine kinase [Winogradskyella psychrotolerans]
MFQIDSLIEESKNTNHSQKERLMISLQSMNIAKASDIDSLVLKANRNLSLHYFYAEDYDKYVSLNQINYKLAKKLNDTTALAVSAGNLASYYKFFKVNDSSFFYFSKSLKYYSSLKNYKEEAYSLMSIADLQFYEKDYTSSETNAILAIKLLNKLPENEDNLDDLWILHNRIAAIFSELNQFEKSIQYHDKAIAIANKMNDGFLNSIFSIHNKAFVYKKTGDYAKAIELYSGLLPLRSKYQEEDPTFYALIASNLGHTKLLNGNRDYSELSKIFHEAHDLTVDYNDDLIRIAVDIDMSKFYLEFEENDSAYIYAKEAYDISKKLYANNYTLEALMLLSQIKKGEEGKRYLNEHIRLSDSLINIERNVRNKFARIEYETDQLAAENKQISKENLYLLILSIGLLVTVILVYILISQRAKNRKLELMQIQQKANEDIYNLMLGQQDKVEEARAKEKTRVSKELHDGVLGGLFGVRLSLDSINFQEGKEVMMTRAKYISQLQTIEQDIRKISHELNTDFVSGSGFMDIVKELIETQTQAYNLEHKFNFTDDINWDLVSNKTKINIYRIIQECMQNIYKHANATTIEISISLEKDLICLDIMDDGSGFDTLKSRKGIGLKNMSSRVDDIKGSINFISQSGNGTTVNVKIPYTN